MTLRGVFHLRCLTIARYSAAISSGLCEVTRRDRGGIAGRWTKPAAASPVCDVPSEAKSLSRTRLGELYPGSTDAASLDSKLEGRNLKRRPDMQAGASLDSQRSSSREHARATRFPSDVPSSPPRLPFAGRNSVMARFPFPECSDPQRAHRGLERDKVFQSDGRQLRGEVWMDGRLSIRYAEVRLVRAAGHAAAWEAGSVELAAEFETVLQVDRIFQHTDV